MSKVWYTSDLHFHHKAVAKRRGFASPAEHDEILLQNWNQSVRKDDIAFILGDFAMTWKGVEARLARMNGRKILISGNHDLTFGGSRDAWKHLPDWIGEGKFESILTFARRKVMDREFLLSHFPYEGDHASQDRPDAEDRHTQYRLRDEGMWLVHGHVHSTEKITGTRQVHVGADAWGLSPVCEEEILALMETADGPVA